MKPQTLAQTRQPVSVKSMAMGMFMLPPAMISLPFKWLLFVLVDGWSLTMQSLIQSFR